MRTRYGNYVATVKDWPGFLAEYTNYKNMGLAAYNTAYLAIGGTGTNQPAGVRFLTKFGAFLNLFKANPGGSDYDALKLNSSGAVELIPCP